ncbi:hypothetical protein T03_13214 [Trichinella britovi]|uniref:Uncharacterized protein n=1 Tax=Trichinella britovi TaxID=45882 RepID=A0A0V1C8F3_TRIBR|nr:hypothetical protein T03_13214 [Trichinella britovi]
MALLWRYGVNSHCFACNGHPEVAAWGLSDTNPVPPDARRAIWPAMRRYCSCYTRDLLAPAHGQVTPTRNLFSIPTHHYLKIPCGNEALLLLRKQQLRNASCTPCFLNRLHAIVPIW